MESFKSNEIEMTLDASSRESWGCGLEDRRLRAVSSTVTCSSSESSSASPASAWANCITGTFGDIDKKYQVDPERIGSGYHASVYQCIERATGKRYAVKSMRKCSPTADLTAMRRECALLKEMNHDNIVRLVDAVEDSSCLHLVTELYTGGELYDRIVQKKKMHATRCFSEGEAVRILRQVLVALSYLHGRAVVHRDLKPENILFATAEEDAPVILVDFGTARRHRGEDPSEPPMTAVVGTARFLAPEVLRQKYDKSCDLWSVGVIAYLLLCGYVPFDGRDNREVYESVRRGRYQFHSKFWSGVSRGAKDFVRRFLQSDPEKRMTIEQALNHRWMAKHAAETVEDRTRADPSCRDVLSNGLRRMGPVLSFSKIRRRAKLFVLR